MSTEAEFDVISLNDIKYSKREVISFHNQVVTKYKELKKQYHNNEQLLALMKTQHMQNNPSNSLPSLKGTTNSNEIDETVSRLKTHNATYIKHIKELEEKLIMYERNEAIYRSKLQFQLDIEPYVQRTNALIASLENRIKELTMEKEFQQQLQQTQQNLAQSQLANQSDKNNSDEFSEHSATNTITTRRPSGPLQLNPVPLESIPSTPLISVPSSLHSAAVPNVDLKGLSVRDKDKLISVFQELFQNGHCTILEDGISGQSNGRAYSSNPRDPLDTENEHFQLSGIGGKVRINYSVVAPGQPAAESKEKDRFNKTLNSSQLFGQYAAVPSKPILITGFGTSGAYCKQIFPRFMLPPNVVIRYHIGLGGRNNIVTACQLIDSLHGHDGAIRITFLINSRLITINLKSGGSNVFCIPSNIQDYDAVFFELIGGGSGVNFHDAKSFCGGESGTATIINIDGTPNGIISLVADGGVYIESNENVRTNN